jgi:hypothetical protein
MSAVRPSSPNPMTVSSSPSLTTRRPSVNDEYAPASRA